jgi:chromosome segregation ATPase
LVELELAGDNLSADKLRKTNRAARTRLEEINGKIDGYRAQLKNNRPLTIGDIEKLRVLAQIEMKNNNHQRDLLYDKIPALESQKDEIEEKIKAIRADAGKITNERIEWSMVDALQILDDRYDKVEHSERERLVKDYLGGKDLELLFRIHEPRKERPELEPKGITITPRRRSLELLGGM